MAEERGEFGRDVGREHGLDVVRAGSMLLGVVLHACVAFMHAPPAGLLWPIHEPGASRACDAVFWAIHAVRVPVFFFVAGALAGGSVMRKPAGVFVASRWRRLMVPMLAASVTVLPAMYAVWAWGWIERGWADTSAAFSHFHFGPEIQRNFRGPAHLWFLLDLFAVSAAFAWSQRVRKGWHQGRWACGVLPALAVAAAVIVGRWPRTVLEFRNSFVPDGARLGLMGIFFVYGAIWWSAAQRERVEGRARARGSAWPGGLMLAVLLLCCAWVVAGSMEGWVVSTAHGLRQGLPGDGAGEWFAAGWVMSGVLSCGAVVSMVRARSWRRPGRVGRYLIDASYWVYLTHLVWVGLFVMLLRGVGMPPEWKAVAVAVLSAAVSLATYWPVRRTWVGGMLGSTYARA